MKLTEQEKLLITKYDLLYEQRLTRVETTLESIVKIMDSMDNRIDNVDKRMTDSFRELKTDFRWLVLIMIGGFGTLFGLMAHGFKWL